MTIYAITIKVLEDGKTRWRTLDLLEESTMATLLDAFADWEYEIWSAGERQLECRLDCRSGPE